MAIEAAAVVDAVVAVVRGVCTLPGQQLAVVEERMLYKGRSTASARASAVICARPFPSTSRTIANFNISVPGRVALLAEKGAIRDTTMLGLQTSKGRGMRPKESN